MTKIMKYALYLVALIIVLFIALVIAVSVLVDPNDYKDQITAKVQESTGRTLQIEGDLSLSFFPWFGIEIGKTELGNAPGFGDQAFAKIDQVSINVQVMPLLSKKLVMDKLILDGLSVQLMRNVQGKTNWDDLVAASETKKKPSREEADTDRHDEDMAPVDLDIGGIRISNANMDWDDKQNQVAWSLRDMELDVGAVSADKPVPVKLSMVATDKKAGKNYPVSLTTVLGIEQEKHQMQMSDLKIVLADLELKGQVSMSGEDASVTGKLTSNEFVPRDLLTELGIELPKTQDPTVFGKASLASSFSMTPAQLALSNLAVKLDDTTVKGNLKLSPLSPAGIRFTLDIDEMDADRYLPPAPEKKDKPAAGAKPAADENAPLPIPVETLRGLNVRGQMNVGKLKAYGIRSTDIKITLNADKGLIKVSPASARLYEGSYAGDIQVDVRGNAPVFSINEKLDGIQAAPLLKDAADLDMVSGRADMSAKVKTRGNTIAQLRKGLNGNAAFSFKDGAIKGVNIPLMLRKANATLTGSPQPPNEPEKTDFTSLTGTAKILNGVVHNNDLLANSPFLRITGKGQVDLVKEQINYTVETTIVTTLQGQGGASLDKLKGVPIPVKVSGPLRDPGFKVDLGKVVTEQQKAKLKKKADKEKDKLKEKLDDKLKGILKF